MRSIQTGLAFPLSSVKPFESLRRYRDYCLGVIRRRLDGRPRRREACLACGTKVQVYGCVEDLSYVRCPSCGSVFLEVLPPHETWATLLLEINTYRHSPEAFHTTICQSRSDNVYVPKLEWIKNGLRLHGISRPRILEVTTQPSAFSALLHGSGTFEAVETLGEMDLMRSEGGPTTEKNGTERSVQAAVLLECLDRIDDPAALVRALVRRLSRGGLVFLTALVSSGFDMAVLGVQNLYLCPPDRTNCFSLSGLIGLLEGAGMSLVEISTPGVLDVEIVQAHLLQDPSLPLSRFERQLVTATKEERDAFQSFLQENRLSSFARIIGRKAE